jgi:hypothetical protein
MAGRLPVQVMDDELETRLLKVAGHPASHDADPNKSYYYIGLGHCYLAPLRIFESYRTG